MDAGGSPAFSIERRPQCLGLCPEQCPPIMTTVDNSKNAIGHLECK
jgi:hypothetical protein